MSISSDTRVTTPAIGDGANVTFPFAFKVFAATDLLVIKTNVAGIEFDEDLGTDYTVALNVDQEVAPGGTVTMLVAPALNELITITSDVDALQPTVITNLGGFFPRVINDSLDRITIIVQQVINLVSRSLKFPISDGAVITELPTRALRRNKYLSFDTNGDVAVNDTPTLAAAGYAAAALTSENNSAAYAASALASANSAATSYDNFDDRYLGQKAADPALDNDGNALLTGALYFNTAGNVMKVWTGAVWQTNNAPADGSILTIKLADGSVTTVKIADSNVTTAKVADANITSVKLADRAVTYPKIDALAKPHGFVNVLRNASMSIFTRGTSGTVTAGNTAYTADGWRIKAVGGTVTYAQTGVVNSPNGVSTRFSLNLNGDSSVTQVIVSQRIESTIFTPLTGQNCTAQIGVDNFTGASITPQISSAYPTVENNWAGQTTDLATVNLQPCPNGAVTAVGYNFTPTNNSNGYEIFYIFNITGGFSGLYLTAADFRATPGLATGINLNPPKPELADLATEITRNARYLPIFIFDGTVNMYSLTGQCINTTDCVIIFPFITKPRVPPTGFTLSNIAHFSLLNAGGSGVVCTGTTGIPINKQTAPIIFKVASGLVAGNASTLLAANSSAYVYFTGAEL